MKFQTRLEPTLADAADNASSSLGKPEPLLDFMVHKLTFCGTAGGSSGTQK